MVLGGAKFILQSGQKLPRIVVQSAQELRHRGLVPMMRVIRPATRQAIRVFDDCNQPHPRGGKILLREAKPDRLTLDVAWSMQTPAKPLLRTELHSRRFPE